MIYQNAKTENTKTENILTKFSDAIFELQIGKLLRNSNIQKNCGIPAFEVFTVISVSGKEFIPLSEFQIQR